METEYTKLLVALGKLIGDSRDADRGYHQLLCECLLKITQRKGLLDRDEAMEARNKLYAKSK